MTKGRWQVTATPAQRPGRNRSGAIDGELRYRHPQFNETREGYCLVLGPDDRWVREAVTLEHSVSLARDGGPEVPGLPIHSLRIKHAAALQCWFEVASPVAQAATTCGAVARPLAPPPMPPAPTPTPTPNPPGPNPGPLPPLPPRA